LDAKTPPVVPVKQYIWIYYNTSRPKLKAPDSKKKAFGIKKQALALLWHSFSNREMFWLKQRGKITDIW